jgi:hypothetical protein
MVELAIDLATAEAHAHKVREAVLRLDNAYGLARFDYARCIRIAPGEIPHSHPILTLNTQPRSDHALLSLYLHEQMHWYVTWYSYRHGAGWAELQAELARRYPDTPTLFPEGAGSLDSNRLHLMVNWLEVEAAGHFLGGPAAAALASINPIYSGIYRIVLRDWDGLSALYHRHALAPIRPATAMTADDLLTAARTDEASSAST